MKLINSISFAIKGIRYCFTKEANFRIHIYAMILVIIASILLNVSYDEFSILIFCCMVVISLEMFNTSIEKLCDIISVDYNSRVKVIKDMAAGAVLLSAIGSLIIGGIIFIPKIIHVIF